MTRDKKTLAEMTARDLIRYIEHAAVVYERVRSLRGTAAFTDDHMSNDVEKNAYAPLAEVCNELLRRVESPTTPIPWTGHGPHDDCIALIDDDWIALTFRDPDVDECGGYTIAGCDDVHVFDYCGNPVGDYCRPTHWLPMPSTDLPKIEGEGGANV